MFEVPKEGKNEKEKSLQSLDWMRGGLDLKGFKGIRRRKYGRKKKKKINSLIVRLMRRLKRGLNKKHLPNLTTSLFFLPKPYTTYSFRN